MNLEEFKKFIETEDQVKRALLGSIIADGYIQKQRKSGNRHTDTNYASLEINHTARNLDYLKFKQFLLSKISGIKSKIAPHNKITKDKVYYGYRLTTNVHPWLQEIRNCIYVNNTKVLPLDVINLFTDLSLLLLYLDDGTLYCRYDATKNKFREVRVKFCLNSFTIEEVKIFIKWLEHKYNILSKFYRDGIRKNTKLPDNRGYVAWLNTTNTKKFMTIIDKFYNLIPSMDYKFLKFHSL